MRGNHKHYMAPGAPLPPDPELWPISEDPQMLGISTMRCSFCGKDVDPEGHRWECTGRIPAPAQQIDTSLEAAAKITKHTARIREAVYLYIAVAGARGMTAGEIANGTGINPSSIRPRLRELEGDAPWCKGRLPRRITRTAAVRKRMHVYEAVAPRDSGNP